MVSLVVVGCLDGWGFCGDFEGALEGDLDEIEVLALVDGSFVGALAALLGGALAGALDPLFPPLGLDPGTFFPVEEDLFRAEFWDAFLDADGITAGAGFEPPLGFDALPPFEN